MNAWSRKIAAGYFLALGLLFVNINFVALAAVEISVNLPGQKNDVSATGPLGFVQQFYNFGLMIGGTLAFGAIVYGGIKYTFAAGNPSGQSEGKEWIKSAILGLLLLALATLILRTINPSLATPTLPNF